MHYKRSFTNLLLWSVVCALFLSLQLQAQSANLSNRQYSKLTFGQSDGYLLDELNYLAFDNDGWLWLSGIRNETQNYQLGARDRMIQRFNGQTFYEVEVPEEVLNGATNLSLLKTNDNSFFVKTGRKNRSGLFRLNPRSLEFTKIQLPEFPDPKKPVYGIFQLKDRVLFIQHSPEGNILFVMNEDDSFRPVGKMKSTEFLPDATVVEFENKILISRYNIGTELFEWVDGKLAGTPMDPASPINEETIVETSFVKNGTTYFTTGGLPNLYKYDAQQNRFIADDVYGIGSSRFQHCMYQDRFGNVIMTHGNEQRERVIKLFEQAKTTPFWSLVPKDEIISRSYFTSRDLTKELIFNKDDRLEIYTFDNDVITTFIENLSIRSMLPYKDQHVMIGTEFDGWYDLDLKTQQIRHLEMQIEGQSMNPQLNRDLYISQGKIWSNSGQAIFSYDLDTQYVKRYRGENGVVAMEQDQDRIYFADLNGSVIQLDKVNGQFKKLVERDSLVYEMLLLKDQALYAASSRGIKVISDKDQPLYTPSEKDRYIVSMLNYDKESLLVGTRTGALYSFNLRDKTFELLYRDGLEASIATVMIDDKDRIWLNTFAGIVVFEPESKRTIRFGMNDGLSHYEANRFSSLKLDDGRFLIGTVRGLNLFHPDSLVASYDQSKLDQSIQLVSVERFDNQNGQVETLVNLEELDELQTVRLPAENRNLLINFGVLKPLLDITYSYRYRLNDSDWIQVENQHEIRLMNLESGTYELEIQALDKTKNTVLSSRILEIAVNEFFYKSAWFYLSIVLLTIFVALIYSFKWRQVHRANYRNKLLKTEIEYKKKDLADFATNISRNKQWNDYLLQKMAEIQESKGRKKGAALVNLEKEIREKNSVEENNFEFQKRIDVISNEFYNSLLERFPTLSKTEIKLCSLIRLDLDAQDIATLQNVDIGSVYKSRYRLRKKLNIQSDVDLDAFLKSL